MDKGTLFSLEVIVILWREEASFAKKVIEIEMPIKVKNGKEGLMEKERKKLDFFLLKKPMALLMMWDYFF